MSTHVKIIGWLHIIFGLFGVLTALALFGGGMLGGAFAGSVKGMIGMGLIGTFVGVIVAVLAIPGLIAGYGLLKYYDWARILMIVIAVLELIRFPLGTILGIYTLWALLSAEGAALFKRQVMTY
jgi:hypothetical protein